MKKIMTRKKVQGRRIIYMLGPSLLVATAAFAETAEKTGSGGISPFMLLFLIFVGAIVFVQLIPAMVIFGSIITAVFKRSKKATETSTMNGQV